MKYIFRVSNKREAMEKFLEICYKRKIRVFTVFDTKNLGKIKILLVGDKPIKREAFQSQLHKLGINEVL